jgi:hypothetical protein
MDLKTVYHRMLDLAEQCDRLASRHHAGTALLPPGMSAVACRDFATHVENAIKSLSPATLEAIASG